MIQEGFLMKKKVLAGVLALAMALSLSGCGQKAENSGNGKEGGQSSGVQANEQEGQTGTESAASETGTNQSGQGNGEKVTVKLAVWSSGAGENFQKAADEFNQRQDKIEFQVEMQTGDYNQFLGAKVASNDLPDLFFLNPYTQVQQFAENDRIMDLSEQGFTANIFDSVKGACSYNDTIYAYPMCLEMLGVYYNQELFEQAGITAVPKTIGEMKEACAKLQEKNITPFAATYKDGWTLNHLYSCLQGAVVGDAEKWITDMNSGSGSFATGETEKVYEFIDLMKANSGTNYMDADSTAGFNAFASGEAAMIITGEFSLLNAPGINPDLKVGLFGVPVTDKAEDAKLDVDVGICVVVNKNTKNPEAALEVLNYLSDNKDTKGWMHYTADAMGAAPPAMEYQMETSYPYYEDYLTYMKTENTKNWIYLQLAAGVQDIVGPAVQGYFTGSTDREQTLKELDSQYANLMAE